MHQFEWNSVYSVGQGKIDEQHRSMMRLANKLNECLLTSYETGHTGQLADLIEATYQLVMKHLSYEELYMADIKYPKLLQHRKIHNGIKNQVNDLYEGIRQGNIFLDTTIVLKFGNMLREHIVNEDKEYCLFADRQKNTGK